MRRETRALDNQTEHFERLQPGTTLQDRYLILGVLLLGLEEDRSGIEIWRTVTVDFQIRGVALLYTYSLRDLTWTQPYPPRKMV